jgi:D-lactate dehydrogenase (cytochrome)
VRHRIRARAAEPAAAPPVNDDPHIVGAFLTDAAHVPGGHAAGVTSPTSEAEVAAAVTHAAHVLPVGAQSSLTGGATPRGELVLSTRALTSVRAPTNGSIVVGAGVPLLELQHTLAGAGLYYPPVPTFEGAFVGGTIATNAAGAATFKYGSTRAWVEALTVVLASGDVLDIVRGETVASADARFEIELPSRQMLDVPLPTYAMPAVPKLSAGFYARAGMDLIDLFIGAEGTLGVITSATLRVIPRPPRSLALIACTDDAQAVAVTAALRAQAKLAAAGQGPLDVAAIEYMDARALRVVPDAAFGRTAVRRPAGDAVLLLVQVETDGDAHAALERLAAVLVDLQVPDDPQVAAPGDERAAALLFELRESVPASVNAAVAAAKARAHPDIQKTAGDMIVPFDRLAESIALYRRVFEARRLDYAIWGHVSDGNLHPNVIPASLEDVERGREAIVEIARAVIGMGGAPLAEHGVGRSALKQQLLRELYGENGIAQMRAVKRALDPGWKLAPGVLFPPD